VIRPEAMCRSSRICRRSTLARAASRRSERPEVPSTFVDALSMPSLIEPSAAPIVSNTEPVRPARTRPTLGDDFMRGA